MSDDARQLIDNPYRASHTPIYVGDVNVTDLMARAWDRGFAAGDERLRAMLGKVPREQLGRIMQEVAATPNAPKADVRRWTPAYGPNGSCCYENENGDYVLARDYDDLAAASPDERLREAGDRLAQAVARVCGEGHPALGMWRVALGTDARGKPDGASVPDQTRRIVVYDARHGRGGLDVPVGCTVGEAALLAAEMFGVRVGPNDRPSFGLRGTGLHASDPLPDDEDYELFVIGGTV